MLNPEIDAKISFGNLKELIKEMSKEYSVKVGILGSKGGEEVSDNLDMAGLGAVHEFGATIKNPGGQPYYINSSTGLAVFVSKKSLFGQYLISKGQVTKAHTITIPARSFIRKPLERSSDLRKKIRQKTQYYSQLEIDLAKELISEHGSSGLLEELAYATALSAIELINEGFETSGFGDWKPDSPITIKRKGSEMPLIDTGRLRRSITFEVEKKVNIWQENHLKQ